MRYLNEKNIEIYQTIIRICELLGFAIIAEGLETMEQVNLLKQTKCHYVQGFYYYKPMSPSNLLDILKKLNQAVK